MVLRGLAERCGDLAYRAAADQLGEDCVDYGRDLDNPRALAYEEATPADAAAQNDDRRMATMHLACHLRSTDRVRMGTRLSQRMCRRPERRPRMPR
ncbi:hypothetical protein [Streptomyces sp. NPDC003952]